jgi:DNA-binding PadR family transcriptional regulator
MAKNELVSLAFLNIQPMHGYLFNKIIEIMHLEHWAKISQASIYPALKRLEKMRAVTIVIERSDNKPDRKIFTITELGRAMLREEMKNAIINSVFEENILFHLAINMFTEEHALGITWAHERIKRLTEQKLAAQGLCLEFEHTMYCAYISVSGSIRHLESEIESTRQFIALLTERPTFYQEGKQILQQELAKTNDGKHPQQGEKR